MKTVLLVQLMGPTWRIGTDMDSHPNVFLLGQTKRTTTNGRNSSL